MEGRDRIGCRIRLTLQPVLSRISETISDVYHHLEYRWRRVQNQKDRYGVQKLGNIGMSCAPIDSCKKHVLISRDCPDDGALFALLLAPLVAAGMLHASLTQLSTSPNSPLPTNWNIESPVVLHSTPIRVLQGITLFPTDAIKALSALATSRRNLVQLFTLSSFVLLVHLARSLHMESQQEVGARSTSPRPTLSSASSGSSGAPITIPVPMERDHSGPAPMRDTSAGTYWLKKGEWKRTKSVVGFSFLVTLCCLGVKVVTAFIGRGVWSGRS